MANEKGTALLLLAAGSAQRMGCNKLLLPIAGKTPIQRCADVFLSCGVAFAQVVVTVSEATEAAARIAFPQARLVRGGASRADSVRRGLALIGENIEVVAIHDAARCLVTPRVIRESVAAALAYGSGIAAIASRDTVRSHGELIAREAVTLAQTPQSFRLAQIKYAYALSAEAMGASPTDDAAVYALAGYTPHFTEGSLRNQKLTYPEDIPLFEAIGGLPCE